MRPKRKFSKNLFFVGVLFLSFLVGCEQKPQPPEKVEVLEERQKKAEIKKQQIKKEYRSMSVEELVTKLEIDSRKGIEPFNSISYREIISRGPSTAQQLMERIKKPDHTSFLTLLALRKLETDIYLKVDVQLGLSILIDALQSSKYFNVWGIPHLYWEDASKALIEYGKPAIPALDSLLQDKRTAPMWGSEEVFEYQKYNYRVCDYAWTMIMEIKGEKVLIPYDAASRDQLIFE